MAYGRLKNKKKSPGKGTKTRQFMLLALREKGVHISELADANIKKIDAWGISNYVQDMYGYDIRHHNKVWYLLGRHPKYLGGKYKDIRTRLYGPKDIINSNSRDK